MTIQMELAAVKYCQDNKLTDFTSGDLTVLHGIYDTYVELGGQPVKNNHPLNILQKVRNGLRTKKYFDIVVVPDYILKRMSIYTLRKEYVTTGC